MTKFTAGAALVLAMTAMTGACAKHDDTANVATDNTIVTDETVTNGVEDNLSAPDAPTNATDAGNAAATGNGS